MDRPEMEEDFDAVPSGAAVDDTPEFIGPEDAVEVQVDDDADDMPMDDEDDDVVDVDDDDDDAMEGADGVAAAAAAAEDMSAANIKSHAGPVYAVASHYDPTTGKLAVISGGGDDRAFLHRVSGAASATTATTAATTATTVPLSFAHSDSVSCAAINLPYVSSDTSKTPRYVAAGGYDGSIAVYDPDTGDQVHQFEGPSDVEWMCFHPNGGTVLLAGSSSDGTVWMFHVPLKKCLQVFVGHESSVTAGSFSPNGRLALTASSDGTARLWDPKTGMSRHVFRPAGGGGGEGPPAGLTCMATGGGTDGQLFIAGAEDGRAHVCHIKTKKVVATLRHYDPSADASTTMMTTTTTTGDDDEDDEEREMSISVEAVGFASQRVNPNWCATGGLDGVLKIWDLSNHAQCRQVCRRPKQRQDGSAPAGGTNIGGDADTNADADDGANDDGANAGDGDGITRLQWHPTMPLVFASDTGGTVNVWDARNGGLLKTLTGNAGMINDMRVEFVPTPTPTAGAGSDTNNHTPNTTADAGRTAVIVTAGDDKGVRVFRVDVASLLQRQQ